MLSAFREALRSIAPADEPWFCDQYRAFLSVDDEDFVLDDALKCLALMYWKGMDDAFAGIIREQTGQTLVPLATDVDWLSAYSEHILGESSAPVDPLTPPAPPAPVAYVRAMSHGIYFTNVVSESGTSETGKIITLGDVGLNDIQACGLGATISFSELIKFTTSRLPNLPALKNLGILQVQNTSLLCWIPDPEPTRCAIAPFRTRQLAQDHAQDHNNLHALASPTGITINGMHVICLRDMIVKITPDQRIYSKVKKTYYTIVHYPEYMQPAIVNYNNPLHLPILLAERILNLSGKYGVGMTAQGTFAPMLRLPGERASTRMPRTLSVPVKDWLRGIKNNELINSNPKWRVNYDCLTTEFL
jgi:hypothetical protein